MNDDPSPAPELDDETQRRVERKAEDDRRRLEQLRQVESDHETELGRQRRQNVRVDVRMPVVIQVLSSELSVRTRDLSATGIGFVTRAPLELDQAGTVMIEFPEWCLTQEFICKFVKPLLAGWQIGAQFVDLSQENRERLVKQVFDIQREQLRTRS